MTSKTEQEKRVTQMKSIRMSKEKLDKWLTALRSGEYKQARGTLFEPDTGYCCLGVLQHCLTGEVEVGLGLPTDRWLADNKIEFLQVGESGGDPIIVDDVDIYGLDSAATLNDDGMPFAQIADLIEACTETY